MGVFVILKISLIPLFGKEGNKYPQKSLKNQKKGGLLRIILTEVFLNGSIYQVIMVLI